MAWRWILKQTVLAAHQVSISLFGGTAGIRDEGLLESALARPLNLAAYGDPTVYDLAAAYAFGIARNHPFLDGNKRTAFLVSARFLELNGCVLRATEVDATLTFLKLAAGELSESELAAWFRLNSEAR